MKVKSESEVTQLCPTLSNPMDCSLPGSSVRGIFQARVLEWGAIVFSERATLLGTKNIHVLLEGIDTMADNVETDTVHASMIIYWD